MRDFMTLGPVPYEEDCVQVNSNEDYLPAMNKEVRRFVEFLNNRFLNIPEGAYFGVKSESHDFGTYKEAAVFYDTNDSDSEEFAFFVECRLPATWDDVEQLDWRASKQTEEVA
jgi:hypothetical protein